MSFDFNNAGPQRNGFDVIPAGTTATLQINVKPGGAGDDGWLKRSKAGDSEALDCEFIVVDGDYAKRKFWSLFTITGTSDGHAKAGDIARRVLRAILESARGIKPDDNSEAATQARRIAGWGDLDGIRFIGVIGVEPAKGNYGPKNILREVITPERKQWQRVEQVAKFPAPVSASKPVMAAASAMERPAWAR
jgi:hypothetical protein